MEFPLEIYGIGIIPIIVGLTRIAKGLGLKNRYLPLISLLLGILIGLVYYGEEIRKGILIGAYLGLSAVGLYSGVKNTLNGNVDKNGKNNDKNNSKKKNHFP